MSSVKPSSEGIQKVKLLMAEMIRPDKPDQKGWTQANLAERSGADLSTVKRFLKGESVKFDSLVWITGAVGLKPEDVIDAPLNETEANIVNWIAICGEMLAKQKEFGVVFFIVNKIIYRNAQCHFVLLEKLAECKFQGNVLTFDKLVDFDLKWTLNIL